MRQLVVRKRGLAVVLGGQHVEGSLPLVRRTIWTLPDRAGDRPGHLPAIHRSFAEVGSSTRPWPPRSNKDRSHLWSYACRNRASRSSVSATTNPGSGISTSSSNRSRIQVTTSIQE